MFYRNQEMNEKEKEILEQEAADKWRKRWQSKDSDLFEWERKKVSPFSNYIDGYIDSAEPREKKIKELEEKIQYLTMGKESLQNLGWPEAIQLFANKEKHIANLEKENAKLKEMLKLTEKLKCCGNCKKYQFNTFHQQLECISNTCEWEMKGAL